jgi:signal transduction histidine kinase
LKKGLQRVGHGEQLEPVRVVSHDELGDLSVMFNDMIQRLKKEEEKRSDFISMLSHEIRTPLTSIKESLSLIQEKVFGPVTEKQAHFLHVSSQEVERLSSLLNRLLIASSMDEQGLVLDRKAYSIKGLIQGGLERVEPTAHAKGIDIRVEDHTGDVAVFADRDHLQQVMVNLIGNAVKFSPEAGIVHVSIGFNQGSGKVVVTVRDQGPGIPDEDRPYVFDRFYRGKGVRTKVDGSGLGLNITRRIIAAHGGDVWLESEPCEGAAFSFELPVGGEA